MKLQLGFQAHAPRPEDIMDEPADLEEHEEPNPIQDEAESDKVQLEPIRCGARDTKREGMLHWLVVLNGSECFAFLDNFANCKIACLDCMFRV